MTELIENLQASIFTSLNGLTDENASEVQTYLTAIFMQSDNDDDTRSAFAKKVLEIEKRLNDDKKSLILLASALEVPWPEYTRGDGYFREPSDLSVELTLLGINNEDPKLVEFSKSLKNCKGIEFFDLGIASNQGSAALDVLFAKNRTNQDPVIAMAAVSPSLTKQQILEVLLELDNSIWLTAVLLKSDGWTWPDWQYAFEQASSNYEPSALFWEVLLTEVQKYNEDDSSEVTWIPDFLEEFEDYEGLDPDVSSENLEFIKSSSSLSKLANESGWDSLMDALEEE